MAEITCYNIAGHVLFAELDAFQADLFIATMKAIMGAHHVQQARKRKGPAS